VGDLSTLVLLVSQGDYNNVVGFPAQGFFEWLGQMDEAGELLAMD